MMATPPSTRFERTTSVLAIFGPAFADIVVALSFLPLSIAAVFGDPSVGWFEVEVVVAVAFAQGCVILGTVNGFWKHRVKAALSGGEPPMMVGFMRLYLLLYPSAVHGVVIVAIGAVDQTTPWFWALLLSSLLFVIPLVVDCMVRERLAKRRRQQVVAGAR